VLLLEGDMVRLMVGVGRLGECCQCMMLMSARPVAVIGNSEVERHLTCTAKPESLYGGG